MEQGKANDRHLVFLKNWVVESGIEARDVIEEMVESVKNVLQPSEERVFDFKVVVNELINNELMHGSGKDVHVSVSAYTSKRVELCVFGTEGFDLQSELQKRRGQRDTEFEESGRGLMLTEALCESLLIDHICGGCVVRARMFVGD